MRSSSRRPEVALETLATGTVRAVDVGHAGEHVFVNNLALGLYPELVQQRERHEDRWGRWMAASVGEPDERSATIHVEIAPRALRVLTPT